MVFDLAGIVQLAVLATSLVLHHRFHLFPAPEIEISDAEIGTSGQLYRLAKRREKLLIDVVEDSRHGVEPLLTR